MQLKRIIEDIEDDSVVVFLYIEGQHQHEDHLDAYCDAKAYDCLLQGCKFQDFHGSYDHAAGDYVIYDPVLL